MKKTIRETGAMAGDLVDTPDGVAKVKYFMPGGLTPKWVGVSFPPEACRLNTIYSIDQVTKHRRRRKPKDGFLSDALNDEL